MTITEKGKVFFFFCFCFFFLKGFVAYKVATNPAYWYMCKKIRMAPIKGHVQCTHDQFNEQLSLTNFFSLLVSLFLLLAHQKPNPLTHEGLGF